MGQPAVVLLSNYAKEGTRRQLAGKRYRMKLTLMNVVYVHTNIKQIAYLNNLNHSVDRNRKSV